MKTRRGAHERSGFLTYPSAGDPCPGPYGQRSGVQRRQNNLAGVIQMQIKIFPVLQEEVSARDKRHFVDAYLLILFLISLIHTQTEHDFAVSAAADTVFAEAHAGALILVLQHGAKFIQNFITDFMVNIERFSFLFRP